MFTGTEMYLFSIASYPQFFSHHPPPEPPAPRAFNAAVNYCSEVPAILFQMQQRYRVRMPDSRSSQSLPSTRKCRRAAGSFFEATARVHS